MIEEQCSTCRYSRLNQFKRLECRYNLPETHSPTNKAIWPIITDSDWCRMWEWDGKCDHSETEVIEAGNIHSYKINVCKRCGSRM